jgi:hypothetical protein
MTSKMPGLPLIFSPFHGGDYYYLREPIYWTPDSDETAKRFKRIDVPAGFVTDLASVPPIFWSVLPKDGAYVHAAVVHDYSYWMQTGTRDEADETLKIGMGELGVPAWQIVTIYEALRAPLVGGARAWADNKQLKLGGERRVLRCYPDDPRVTWKQWKDKPDVFKD